MTDIDKYKDNYLKRLQDTEGIYIPPYLRAAIKSVEKTGTIEKWMSSANALVRAHKLDEESKFRPRSKKNKVPHQASRGPYPRSLNKGLYLVDFVIGKELKLKHFKNRSFGRRRIGWKKVCMDWNEAHPHDTRTPDNLKKAFYRAINDENIQREYWDKRYKEFNDSINKTLEPIRRIMAETFMAFSKKSEGALGQSLFTIWKSAWSLGNTLVDISNRHNQLPSQNEENPVTINLDKERHLQYSYSSLSQSLEKPLEDIAGSIVKDSIEEGMSDISTLLWAGLIWEDGRLTKEQIEDYISLVDIRSLPYIFDTLDEALSYIVA